MCIKEGDKAKTVKAFGRCFTLYYGYYTESDKSRGSEGLMPIYPDFRISPEYTKEGLPFVTQMQDACPHLSPIGKDGDCFSCRYYKQGEDLIGVCTHPAHKKRE